MNPKLPGPFQVVEGNSTTLYVDDEFGLAGGRNYYLAEVRHGDPDELLRLAHLFAASRDLLDAALAAENLLDSVAFVAREGDTAKPLRMLRAAISAAIAAQPAQSRDTQAAAALSRASYSDLASDGGLDPRNEADLASARQWRQSGA